jgi:hypothetical protein
MVIPGLLTSNNNEAYEEARAWKGYDLDDTAAAIGEGLVQCEGKDMDIVLLELQHAPALLTTRLRQLAAWFR